MSTLLLLLAFHGIIAQAELRIVGQTTATHASEEPDDGDDEADIAAQRVGGETSMRAGRLQSRRRLQRARLWLCDAGTLRSVLIWCCVGQHAMKLHFNLFATGSIHPRVSDDKKPALFRLAGIRESKAVEVMSILFASFFSWAGVRQEAVWGLAEAFYGPMAEWSHDMCRQATTAVNRVVGNLWRRFYVRLRGWPWKLIRYCDDSLSEAERRGVAQKFLDTPKCCLDPYVGRRLQAMVRDIADMFLPPVVAFVKECFVRSLASTTHVENAFAHVRSYLSSCRRPPSVAALAAHHVITECHRVHKAWLAGLPDLRKSALKRRCGTTDSRKRAMWAASRQQMSDRIRHNGYSAFVKWSLPKLRREHAREVGEPANLYNNRILSFVSKAWADLGHARQQAYSLRSQASKKRRKTTEPDPVAKFVLAASFAPNLAADSPWGVGDERFALGECALHRRMQQDVEASRRAGAQAQSFVASQQKQWREHCGCSVPPAGVIPDQVTVDTPCSEICNRCVGCLNADMVQLKTELAKAVQVVSKASRGMPTDFDSIVIWFHRVSDESQGVCIVLCSFLKSPQFSAEYIKRQHLNEAQSVQDRSIAVSYFCQHEAIGGKLLPEMLTETDLAMELVDMVDESSRSLPAVSLFRFHEVSHHVSPPGVYNLAGHEAVDFGALLEQQTRARVAAAA